MATFNKKYTVLISAFLWLVISLVATSSINAQPRHDQILQSHSSADPILVREYTLDAKGTINVFTATGNITLASVPDSRVVRIELFADRGFSFGSLFNSSDDYRIVSFKRGSEITTSAEPKGKQSGFWGSPSTFSYKITVPEQISTNLKTLSGSVSIQSVEGQQLLKSSGGNITIDDVHGTVKAYTSGGSINVKNSQGTIFAKVDGGQINAENTTGELRMKIQGGNIYASDISGSMIAQVNAGNIDAAFNSVGRGVDLQTNAGNINLAIPKSNGYKLYARGSSVQFDEAGVFQGTYSENMAEGSVNGGGLPINLTANAGTVTLHLKK